MNQPDVFVFRCDAGRCSCKRRAEVTLVEGEVNVYIEGEGVEACGVISPEELATELADGMIDARRDSDWLVGDWASIEITEPTALRLRNWLKRRGVVLP